MWALPILPRSVEKQIVGLEVAMDDSLFVRGREDIEQLVRDAHGLLDRLPAELARPARLGRLAFETLQHENEWKNDVEGKGVTVRVELGGRRNIKTQKH